MTKNNLNTPFLLVNNTSKTNPFLRRILAFLTNEYFSNDRTERAIFGH